MRKRLKMIFIAFLLLLLIPVSIIVLIIAFNSPGRLSSLTNEQGVLIAEAITLKEKTSIGGIEQGFFIRSENPDNPVILFLHGGPGSPELPLIEPTEQSERLEKYFTVCYWDQRGAGMTYTRGMDTHMIRLSQYVEDTRQMTEYLLKRFGKDKIYLMGHSWGSYLGVKTIEKYPDYYYAYMGIGQVTDQRLSEQLAYDYMLNHAWKTGDKKAEKILKRFDRNSPDFPTFSYLGQARVQYMNKYGIGVTHIPYSTFAALRDVMLFKGYTFSEKIGYLRGNLFSLKNVFHYVLKDNLFESSRSFEVPVYILHGIYDYQVSYKLAKEWMEDIEAPAKAFYSFENSAHSPNMEENQRFVSIVRDIVSLHY